MSNKYLEKIAIDIDNASGRPIGGGGLPAIRKGTGLAARTASKPGILSRLMKNPIARGAALVGGGVMLGRATKAGKDDE